MLKLKSLPADFRAIKLFKLFSPVLVVTIMFSWALIREIRKVNTTRISSWVEDHHGDCAVVLTGRAGRIKEGMDLLSQKQIKKLILAGVNPGSNLRQIFPQWPFYGEISEQDVILEKRSQTTYGNAQQALSFVEALHCRDLVLITSHVHMYRAYRTFRSVIPDSIPIYARGVLMGNLRSSWDDLLEEGIKSLFYSIWAY
ncbi:MAG: YdcF family protein [Pseudomonadota bacterium]|nr:YdcF family protein [Pseudomonadota bacterium]